MQNSDLQSKESKQQKNKSLKKSVKPDIKVPKMDETQMQQTEELAKKLKYTNLALGNKRVWSYEEDTILMYMIALGDPRQWDKKSMALPTRTGKQCRERWHNQLNPRLRRGRFSSSEEWIVVLRQMGLKNQWAKVAEDLPGRSDNSIKNHWNVILSFKEPNYLQTVQEYQQKFMHAIKQNALQTKYILDRSAVTGNYLSQSFYDYLLLAFRHDVTIQFKECMEEQIESNQQQAEGGGANCLANSKKSLFEEGPTDSARKANESQFAHIAEQKEKVDAFKRQFLLEGIDLATDVVADLESKLGEFDPIMSQLKEEMQKETFKLAEEAPPCRNTSIEHHNLKNVDVKKRITKKTLQYLQIKATTTNTTAKANPEKSQQIEESEEKMLPQQQYQQYTKHYLKKQKIQQEQRGGQQTQQQMKAVSPAAQAINNNNQAMVSTKCSNRESERFQHQLPPHHHVIQQQKLNNQTKKVSQKQPNQLNLRSEEKEHDESAEMISQVQQVQAQVQQEAEQGEGNHGGKLHQGRNTIQQKRQIKYYQKGVVAQDRALDQLTQQQNKNDNLHHHQSQIEDSTNKAIKDQPITTAVIGGDARGAHKELLSEGFDDADSSSADNQNHDMPQNQNQPQYLHHRPQQNGVNQKQNGREQKRQQRYLLGTYHTHYQNHANDNNLNQISSEKRVENNLESQNDAKLNSNLNFAGNSKEQSLAEQQNQNPTTHLNNATSLPSFEQQTREVARAYLTPLESITPASRTIFRDNNKPFVSRDMSKRHKGERVVSVLSENLSAVDPYDTANFKSRQNTDQLSTSHQNNNLQQIHQTSTNGAALPQNHQPSSSIPFSNRHLNNGTHSNSQQPVQNWQQNQSSSSPPVNRHQHIQQHNGNGVGHYRAHRPLLEPGFSQMHHPHHASTSGPYGGAYHPHHPHPHPHHAHPAYIDFSQGGHPHPHAHPPPTAVAPFSSYFAAQGHSMPHPHQAGFQSIWYPVMPQTPQFSAYQPPAISYMSPPPPQTSHPPEPAPHLIPTTSQGHFTSHHHPHLPHPASYTTTTTAAAIQQSQQTPNLPAPTIPPHLLPTQQQFSGGLMREQHHNSQQYHLNQNSQHLNSHSQRAERGVDSSKYKVCRNGGNQLSSSARNQRSEPRENGSFFHSSAGNNKLKDSGSKMQRRAQVVHQQAPHNNGLGHHGHGHKREQQGSSSKQEYKAADFVKLLEEREPRFGEDSPTIHPKEEEINQPPPHHEQQIPVLDEEQQSQISGFTQQSQQLSQHQHQHQQSHHHASHHHGVLLPPPPPPPHQFANYHPQQTAPALPPNMHQPQQQTTYDHRFITQPLQGLPHPQPHNQQAAHQQPNPNQQQGGVAFLKDCAFPLTPLKYTQRVKEDEPTAQQYSNQRT